MTIATVTLVVIAAVLFIVAWRRGDGSHREGAVQGWRTLRRSVVLLLLAFAIVGYITALSPQDLVQTWIGPDSGWTGLLLGTLLGIALPGGPYVVFPLIAVLYQAGAGVGPTVALITSWAMLAFISLTFELSFMGWRFSAARWGLGLLFPIIAGFIAQLLLA
jgi:uncharacterized membrane protein YraQ (UPF0718 family)